MRAPRDRPGVALLATLLAIALMTILVVEFGTSTSLGYRAAANQANELRALYLARSGVQAGLALLEQQSFNAEIQRLQAVPVQPYSSLTQPWALPLPPIPVAGGTVKVAIVDEERKLNLDQLFNLRTRAVDNDYAQMIARLFEMIGVSTDLLPVLIDWLDPDSVVTPGGAEADYYLRLTPPYEPRNGPLPTIADLRACKGVDDATFMLLAQYLTAIGTPIRVDVNTASPAVLAALTPELSNNPELVKEIVAARAATPFTMVTDLANLPGVGAMQGELAPEITTLSTYFTIIGEGDFAGARRRIYATFRPGSNGSSILLSWHED